MSWPFKQNQNIIIMLILDCVLAISDQTTHNSNVCNDYMHTVPLQYVSRITRQRGDLRIDSGGLECTCTWYCVFSDSLAIHRSIWRNYISN